MDYEKKYNEALERAKYVLHTVETAGCAMHKDLLTEIFPELTESEDERIRKVIYKLMLGMREEIFTSQDEIVTKEKALAYLEKKPGIKIWPHEIIDAMNGEHDPADIYSEDGRLIAKKDESEDERIRKKLVWLLQQDICPFPEEEVAQMLAYLEKQKEQKPAWKPSEEQMNALNFAITYMFSTKANPTVLRDLYNDLLKLK